MKMCYWELIAFYCIGTRQCKMYLVVPFAIFGSDSLIVVSSRSSESEVRDRPQTDARGWFAMNG